jgi:hypothetical protein
LTLKEEIPKLEDMVLLEEGERGESNKTDDE